MHTPRALVGVACSHGAHAGTWPQRPQWRLARPTARAREACLGVPLLERSGRTDLRACSRLRYSISPELSMA
eukprot:scaffold26129_cov75-Phaeocystis_antarctica.AAC.2